jgi:four helix bundle protein
MSLATPKKRFDLEGRTSKFAKDVRRFIRFVPRTISTFEDCKQLVRSSGSIAANYIEANEGLSRNDYLYRVKICRKESKETILWLDLLDLPLESQVEMQRQALLLEVRQLVLIFATILRKSNAIK